MPKPSSSSSNFAMKKCYRQENNVDADCSCCHLKEKLEETDAEDQISRLPNDVLVLILSHLPMKDAAKTNILSRRWRYLWTFFTGTLDFDASLTLEELRFPLGSGNLNSLREERLRFVRWVNQVLGLHQALTVDGLRIIFDVGYECDVDNWVKFALDKKVQKLELDFTDLRMADYSELYAFPSQLFENSNPSSLTALHLKRVNVTGGTLECLLSHCPFLEVLSVKNSSSLLSLNIWGGPTLKLKYLEIWGCRNFEKLEISAVNLLSFSYRGPEVVHFKHVPQLLELRVAGSFFKVIVDKLFQHLSFLSQLKTLNLHFTGPLELIMTGPQQFPELNNLKYLELKVSLLEFGDLFLLAPLLRASPSLHKLTLLICYAEMSSGDLQTLIDEHTYHCLKVVEFIGFVGSTAEVEFLLHLSKNSVSLEKMIIDPCRPYPLGELFKSRSQILKSKFRETKEYLLAKERAIELQQKLPSDLEIVVL